MLKIQVEGIYETDIGSGQKTYQDFSYDFEVSRNNLKGIETHIQKRFIPYLIKNDKTKSNKVFSRLKNYVIRNAEEVQGESNLLGKDIMSLSEWEIQDLACMLDLYEIPLPQSTSLAELRELSVLAYLKKVLKVPMSTPEQKARCDFLLPMSDGSYKLDLKGQKVLVKIPENYFGEIKKTIEKKSISFFEKLAGVFGAEKEKSQDVDINTTDLTKADESQTQNAGAFPSANQLLENSADVSKKQKTSMFSLDELLKIE